MHANPTSRIPALGSLIASALLTISVQSQAVPDDGNKSPVAAPADSVRIQVDPKTVVSRIAPDFIGFGYETSIAAVADYFSPNNSTLIQLYRNLTPHGLIRIGGNVSDHTKFRADGPRVAGAETGVTHINSAGLRDLGGFARATGWKVMWGLNLGTGSKEEAVEEAKAVDALLGAHLHSLQIGNEVDLRGGYKNTYKDYDGYYANFREYKAAIRTVLPHAAFSGPDVANDMAWLKSFAGTEAKDIKLLTYHYYRTGAPAPEATIETLLKAHDGWIARMKQLQTIAQDHNSAYRINELNSFYGGGKPGVSDTFASALWCLDNMFLLASHGCNGVNMQTDINHRAWISHYSPIIHDEAMHCSARPEYYGMLAFAMAGKGALVKLGLDKNDINVTAYATKDEQGLLWITVVNKDLARDASVEAKMPEGYVTAEAFRLSAPSAESKDHVTFAGAEVAADGKWTPGAAEPVTPREGVARLTVPHASALVLRLRQ